MEELEKDNGIPKDYLLESIETALVTAYKRNFDSAENVKVTMDRETGEIHVYAEKDVVEIVEDPQLQINLQDAKNINKNLEIGDKAEVEIIPKNFGRIAAQTAKQVIVQKIREVSRNVLFKNLMREKAKFDFRNCTKGRWRSCSIRFRKTRRCNDCKRTSSYRKI